MANTLLSTSVIAREAIMQLENNLVLSKRVFRGYEEDIKDQYKGNKPGGTISIRRPVQYTVREGSVAQVQDTIEGKTTITIDTQQGVDMSFSSKDMTLTIGEFSERYIKPAMIQLANKIDVSVQGLYKDVWNWAGTPSGFVNSHSDFQKAPTLLNNGAVPMDGRYACLTPDDHAALVSSFTSAYVEGIAGPAIRGDKLPTVAGIPIEMSQNVLTHTVGAHGGTPKVDSTQSTTYAASKDTNTMTLVTDGWSTSVGLKKGDVFTIDGVYAVNPVSKATLTYLQQFVITEDVTTASNASNDTEITISPPIITSGAYQTVSAAAVNDVDINYMGTASTGYAQNLVFRRDAFALAMIPMELPQGAVVKERRTKNGFSIRMTGAYDINNDNDIFRFDVLYGVKTIDPRQACRLSGSS